MFHTTLSKGKKKILHKEKRKVYYSRTGREFNCESKVKKDRERHISQVQTRRTKESLSLEPK